MRRVTYGKRTMSAQDAAGITGMLLKSGADGRWFFRTGTPETGFVDYELRHDDLVVTIAGDALAALYTPVEGGGDNILDHSPQVLGLRSAVAGAGSTTE